MSRISARIKLPELEYFLSDTALRSKEIENTQIYKLVRELTSKVKPSYKDEYDTKWEDFYLAVKRGRGIVFIPFSIFEYKKEFYVYFFNMGSIHIKKGNQEEERIFKEIFKEAIRFARQGWNEKDILKKKVPYDFRTGRIKGKYVLDKIMPKNEAEEVLDKYKQHVNRGLKVSGVSLNDYLNTAAICYRAAYGDKTRDLTPLEMYKKWADGRDGGMLSIKDPNSKEEFHMWHKSYVWAGSHPFEIVFSWHRHGIHLYPPSEERADYLLRVTNYAYAEMFILMVKELIQNQIAFQAHDLEDVLEFLTGESWFIVNTYDEHSFRYFQTKEYRREYFKHIIWDELKILEEKK